MEEKNISLPEEQAYKSAPKIGSILFALFYTFCLYRNAAGITYPFFVAGSLLYLFYCIKKCGSTAGKENYCIAGSMLLLGVIQCTTTSTVVISSNRLLIWGLGLVILIRSVWQERIADWNMYKWLKNVLCAAFIGFFKGFWIFPDILEDAKEHRETENSEKAEHRRHVVKAVFLGILIAVPLIFFISYLLSSADVLFRNLFMRVIRFMRKWNLPAFLTDAKVWGCLFMIGSSCLAVYGLNRLFFTEEEDENEDIEIVQGEKKEPDQITGLIIVGSVGIVYLLFCFIQIFGLFLRKMSLPEMYTYAEYAREGFFQLAALCAMNICFVMVIAKYFKLSRLMKCFLIVVSGCTYIMIASSAYKMIMYVQVYQLSFLRLTVLWALVVMAVLMSGVMYRILTEKDHLVRFFFIVLLAAYCIFVTARPDYLIARYNVSQKDFSGEAESWRTVDFRYLYHDLSTDAAPVWIGALENPGDATEAKYMLVHLKEEKDNLSFRTFNFSQYYAGKLAEKKLEESYGVSWEEERKKTGELGNNSEKDLINMTMEQRDGYAVIAWDDKIFVPYCAVSIGEEGQQIGFIDGDRENKVYEYKGYPSNEWIINAFDHDGGMLWREVTVINIPDGLTSEYEWNSEMETELPESSEIGQEQGMSEDQTKFYEIPEAWLSIRPDATWEFEDGSKWDMVPVDRAAGSNYYALLGTAASGEKILVNDDPFHGSGGGSIWLKCIDEVGFASLTHNGGAEGSLYRTYNGGLNFSCVEIPPVMVQASNGEFFTPYDTPADVWTNGKNLFLLMSQGEDGDYYENGKKTSAIYISSDRGETWSYWDVAK